MAKTVDKTFSHTRPCDVPVVFDSLGQKDFIGFDNEITRNNPTQYILPRSSTGPDT